MLTADSKQKPFRVKTMLYDIMIISAMALLIVAASTKIMAQGNLLLTPRRVVFEGAKKSMDLNLANTGKDTARYVI